MEWLRGEGGVGVGAGTRLSTAGGNECRKRSMGIPKEMEKLIKKLKDIKIYNRDGNENTDFMALES